MKILDNKSENKFKDSSKNKISDQSNQHKFNLERTPISRSLLFLFLEIFIPWILLWLFTSPEIGLKTFNISLGFGILWSFILLIIVTSLIIGMYFLGLHQYDQFTICYGFFGLICGFYLSSFWWNSKHFLWQSLISLGFIIVFMLIGTILSAFFKYLKTQCVQKLNLNKKNN